MSLQTNFNNSLTKSFVDLATYDQHEVGMYGGNDAITYFVRKVVKATWFAKGITQLQSSGSPTNLAWNQEQDINFTISRAGDYLMNCWLRIVVPAVSLTSTAASTKSLRWTRNLAHNLFKDIQVTFNDLNMDVKKDNYYLDFWAAFTVPASKRVGYDNMIGNVDELINPCDSSLSAGIPTANVTFIPSYVLNLPLPLPFTRDTGIALPTAALPYNEMKIELTVRPLQDVLIIDAPVTPDGTLNGGSSGASVYGVSYPSNSSDVLNFASQTLNIQCFAEYALVSNQERVRMGSCPRDILIEQSQETSPVRFAAGAAGDRVDIRFSYPVKALMFGVRNNSVASEWSNYTCAAPVVNTSGGVVSGITFDAYRFAVDPIDYTRLYYENDIRFELPADYFSLVSPYYAAISIPEVTGYHLWSYTLDLASVDPKGSTNYGKLTNATVEMFPSALAQVAVAPTTSTVTPGSGGFRFLVASPFTPQAQTFNMIVVAINHNFVRVTGGAQLWKYLGHQQQTASQVTDFTCEGKQCKNLYPNMVEKFGSYNLLVFSRIIKINRKGETVKLLEVPKASSTVPLLKNKDDTKRNGVGMVIMKKMSFRNNNENEMDNQQPSPNDFYLGKSTDAVQRLDGSRSLYTRGLRYSPGDVEKCPESIDANFKGSLFFPVRFPSFISIRSKDPGTCITGCDGCLYVLCFLHVLYTIKIYISKMIITFMKNLIINQR